MKDRQIYKYSGVYFFRKLKGLPVLSFFSSPEIDFSQNIKNNFNARLKFLDNLALDYNKIIFPRQTHGDKIVIIKDSRARKNHTADALITKNINTPLTVLTADCLSIFLYDKKNNVVSLVHAGWRGTLLNIAKKVVLEMKKNYFTNPSDLLVCFGPSIRNCCYLVGTEFRNRFNFGLIERKNKFYLDLPQINRRQLESQGIKKQNIIDSQICTACGKENFFSYRRSGKNCGRMISLIMLKNDTFKRRKSK